MEQVIEKALAGLSEQERAQLGKSFAEQFNGALEVVEKAGKDQLMSMRKERASLEVVQ